jgi:hypothetical protein
MLMVTLSDAGVPPVCAEAATAQAQRRAAVFDPSQPVRRDVLFAGKKLLLRRSLKGWMLESAARRQVSGPKVS